MRVIAIDPGVETGYCYAIITEDKQLEYYPFQSVDDVDDLWRRLVEFKPRHIVMEDFEFRGGARAGLNLFPVQLIGVARLYSLISTDGQIALRLQKAAQGKSYYTDPTLKQAGLYKRGIQHGMDASRHLLQWVTFGEGYQYVTGKQNFATLLDKWET